MVAGCTKVPYTGRHQINLVSNEQEMQLGQQAYAETLKQTPESSDEKAKALVLEVGKRIAAAANQPDFKWEFHVLKSDQVNAFCLPGGKVAFYEGIMPICQDANGVAVVMGHEVAHALAHHGGERMSQAMGAGLIGEVLQVGLANKDAATQQTVMTAFGLGAQVGVLLPFSRRQESEADHIGLILMAKAGYDPKNAVAFWQRMTAKAGNGAPPAFLSDHPSDEKRIQQIQDWLPEAQKEYRPQ